MRSLSEQGSRSWEAQRRDDQDDARGLLRAAVFIVVAVILAVVAINLVDRAGASQIGGCIQTSGWDNAGCSRPVPFGTALATIYLQQGTEQAAVVWNARVAAACVTAERYYPNQWFSSSYQSGVMVMDPCHGNSPGYGFAEVRTAIVVPGNPTIYTRQLISPWGVVATDVTGGGGGCGFTRWCN